MEAHLTAVREARKVVISGERTCEALMVCLASSLDTDQSSAIQGVVNHLVRSIHCSRLYMVWKRTVPNSSLSAFTEYVSSIYHSKQMKPPNDMALKRDLAVRPVSSTGLPGPQD